MQMYMPHISKMPMFKNLGIELLAMICGVVELGLYPIVTLEKQLLNMIGNLV